MGDALSAVKDDVETFVSTSSKPFKFAHGQIVFFVHEANNKIQIVSGKIYDSEISRKRDGIVTEKYCIEDITDKQGNKLSGSSFESSVSIKQDYCLFKSYEEVLEILR